MIFHFISHSIVSAKSLRKQAYSNILKNLPPKKIKKIADKNSDIFHISAQNIDFWAEIMYTPVNPSFTI